VKAPLFEYHAAESVDETLDLLAEYGDEAKVLAGGQSLMPLLSLRLARPAHLVDINRVPELAGINVNGAVEIGAMVRHRVAERSGAVTAANPLLAAALGLIGHAAIRNRGTIGGSIAHADPAAELPAVLVAAGGEAKVEGRRGTRIIPAEQLFQGFLTTAVDPDELVTAVRLPAWPARAGGSFTEFSRRSGDFAIVGVATILALDGAGKIAQAGMAFSGVAGTPVRARAAEAALVGQTPSADLWQHAAAEAAAGLDPPDDLHGTSAYRKHLASVLAARSLKQAHQRAEEAV
jgi:carbon-monoxide dehydrogenase medium subunit